MLCSRAKPGVFDCIFLLPCSSWSRIPSWSRTRKNTHPQHHRRFNLESSTDPIRFRDASFAAGLYKTPLLVCAPLPCHSPVHCNEDASGYCVVCGRLPTADAISLGAMTVGVAPGAGSISSATQYVLYLLYGMCVCFLYQDSCFLPKTPTLHPPPNKGKSCIVSSDGQHI